MLTPVIFRHDFAPGFATECTSEDWAAVAALVAAVYQIDSSAYSAPGLDLCNQLQQRAHLIPPRGTGLVFIIEQHPTTPTIEVTIQRPDQTIIKALIIYVHSRAKE